MGRREQHWVPAEGTLLDDRYRIGPMIERGGMGVIMRAEHIRMKRDVAVKLLNPDVAGVTGFRARFQREVDVATGLEHPHIVRCYDFGETADGVLYLVMELLEGQSLQATLDESGRLELRRAARLTLQLLDGLACAHLREVVHRDLKPSNAFVANDLRGNEVVKLLDFGLAKSLSSGEVSITATGAICGTPSYLAPETLVTQQVSPAGDVYAIGLLMLEMVLGRQVFASWSMAQTFLQQLMLPARIPRRIWDTPYGALMASALHKHPDDRPQNAEAMYQQLAAVIDDLPELRLEPHELPPLSDTELTDSFLQDLATGRLRHLDALRLLPGPEPWDPDSIAPDDRKTQTYVLGEIEAMMLAELEQKTTDTVDVRPRPQAGPYGHDSQRPRPPTVAESGRPGPDRAAGIAPWVLFACAVALLSLIVVYRLSTEPGTPPEDTPKPAIPRHLLGPPKSANPVIPSNVPDMGDDAR